MNYVVSFAVIFLQVGLVFSQSFSGSGGSIPDDGGTEVAFSLPVSGLPTVADANYGLERVCFNIQHPYTGDLEISLEAPDGSWQTLVNHAGGGSADFTSTCLDGLATISVQTQSGPFTGNFKPFSNIGNYNNGSNPNGTWILHVLDNALNDQGTVLDWTLTFGSSPALPTPPLTASELAIFSIQTNGQNIQNEPKTLCDLKVFWNSDNSVNDIFQTPHYNGKIGIEFRGSSSSSFPKQSFGFETWDGSSQAINVPLVNFPTESDWILSANYSDKSLMNNVLSYHLFRQMGHYAPRTKFAELLINDQYQGVYVFMEKIKRDSGRVDVSKLTTLDVAGPDLTGGYIIKIDKFTGSGGGGWNSNYQCISPNPGDIFFQYEYPNDATITAQQSYYIQQYVDSFETALFNGPYGMENQGWRKYADEASFIDYLLVNELSKNVDGYRLSTYLSKSKITKGGKLAIGPVWDYDLGYGNANYCEGSTPEGWAFNFNYVCGNGGGQVPFWWDRLTNQDELFRDKLACRYQELRTSLFDINYLFDYIDSTVNFMQQAVARNFETWNILGSYVWPNPEPVPTTYSSEIQELKEWLVSRLDWMDQAMPSPCLGLQVEATDQDPIRLYPNPVKDQLELSASAPIEGLQITDLHGKVIVCSTEGSASQLLIDTRDLSPGMYVLHFRVNSVWEVQKFVKN